MIVWSLIDWWRGLGQHSTGGVQYRCLGWKPVTTVQWPQCTQTAATTRSLQLNVLRHFLSDIKHIFCHLLADKIKTTQTKQWASELKASHVFMLDISYLPSRETHYLEVDSDGQLTCFLWCEMEGRGDLWQCADHQLGQGVWGAC